MTSVHDLARSPDGRLGIAHRLSSEHGTLARVHEVAGLGPTGWFPGGLGAAGSADGAWA